MVRDAKDWLSKPAYSRTLKKQHSLMSGITT
jgi:hypothetical protein